MSFENFNVLDFGADPTGKDNSWQAFKDWSTAISNAGGGIGLVPSGTYKIDKVAVAGAWWLDRNWAGGFQV